MATNFGCHKTENLPLQMANFSTVISLFNKLFKVANTGELVNTTVKILNIGTCMSEQTV